MVNPVYKFIASLIVVALAAGIAAAQPAAPMPTTTPITTSASENTLAQEIAEQMRRQREQSAASGRNARTNLLSMRVRGIESFGDMLDPGAGETQALVWTTTGTMKYTGITGLLDTNPANPDHVIFSTPTASTRYAGLDAEYSTPTGAPTTGKWLATYAPGELRFAGGGLIDDAEWYLSEYASTGTMQAFAPISQDLQDILDQYGYAPGNLTYVGAPAFSGDGTNPASPTFSAGTGEQNFLYSLTQTIEIPLPPGGGGGGAYGLGRQKISENMAPLPMNRFILDFSYFHNVPLGYRDIGVSRLTPGIEKMFFRDRMSVEVRCPLAVTLDSNIREDKTTATNVTRVGDMTVLLKALVFQRNNLSLTCGLGMSLPTAEDVRMIRDDGETLIFWENKTVHLMPYFGMLYSPPGRLFYQGYFKVDTAIGGDPTSIRNVWAEDDRLVSCGRTFDRTYAYTSLAVGYWLHRHCGKNSSDIINGLNLMAELHWTEAMDKARGIEYTEGNHHFSVGQSTSTYSIAAATFGARVIRNRNLGIGVGYAVPLGDRDRQFDGELRFSINRYF